jgi:hypothetical protein
MAIALVVLAVMSWIKWDGAFKGRVIGSLF